MIYLNLLQPFLWNFDLRITPAQEHTADLLIVVVSSFYPQLQKLLPTPNIDTQNEAIFEAGVHFPNQHFWYLFVICSVVYIWLPSNKNHGNPRVPPNYRMSPPGNMALLRGYKNKIIIMIPSLMC